MKKFKSIFFGAIGLSILLLGGCSMNQSLPYSDVYYSSSDQSPAEMIPPGYANTTNSENNVASKKGNLEVISLNQAQTNQNKTSKLINNDSLSNNKNENNYYNNISVGLGFNSSNFGSSVWDWSLGNNWGWNYDPIWASFYSPYYYGGFPYYGYGWNNWGWNSWGWNNWGWGYPYSWSAYYWDWGYPYGAYAWGYPTYYGVFSPVYFSPSNVQYGHRGNRFNGRNVAFGGGGIMPLYNRTSIKSKSSAVNANNTATNINRRPSGSIRYRSQLIKDRSAGLKNSERLQKPEYRGSRITNNPGRTRSFSGSNISVKRYSQPQKYEQRRVVQQERPRYQKPRQYRRLDNRQPRNSKEYFRPQPNNRFRERTSFSNQRNIQQAPRPVRKYNIYRPSRVRFNNPGPVFNRSSNNNRNIRQQRSFNPGRSFRIFNNSGQQNNTPTRTFSAPYRGNNNSSGGGNSGGGGSRQTSGGGGGIRR